MIELTKMVWKLFGLQKTDMEKEALCHKCNIRNKYDLSGNWSAPNCLIKSSLCSAIKSSRAQNVGC